MATYNSITAWLKANYDFGAQSCWIADIKSGHGLVMGQFENSTRLPM